MAEIDNKKLAQSRGGATPEESESLTGQAGLYKHKVTGAEIATKWDPLYGNVQSEALLRQGEWERVGDVPEGYAKELVPGSVEAEASKDRAGATIGEVKGINARLDAMEAENARLKEKLAIAEGKGTPNEVVGADETKAEATTNVESGHATGEAEATTGTENTPGSDELPEGDEDEEPEKALSAQNTSELRATAAAEGVELTEAHDTNKKIREAIQIARDAAASESEN